MAAFVKNGPLAGLVIGLLILWSSPFAFSLNSAGDVFALDIWKLAIPLDDDGDGVADVVTMPTLRNFEDPDFFYLSKTGDAIIFRARCGDVRGKGSDTPRSQLQEVKKNSEVSANWGSNDGLVHNLTITFTVHAAPKSKVCVIASGIYEGESEILTVRLEGGELLLTRAGLDPLILVPNYVPGTLIELMIIIDHARVRALLATRQIGEWPLEKTGLHFRAGCEVPSSPETDEASKDFGEVEIQKLYVTHKPR